MKNNAKEKAHYEPLKKKLEELIKRKYEKFYLEITATKGFSNELKSKIGKERELIFSFLKEAKPDMTGYFTEEYLFGEDKHLFLVIEVKQEQLKLDYIYQTKKYAELFDARMSLLISLEEIPEEIKRLSKVVRQLLSLPDGKKIILAHFDCQNNEFKEWFPRNPFKSSWF